MLPFALKVRGGSSHDTRIHRTPARLGSDVPLPSQWNLCLLNESPDRSLVLELSRLPRVVSLRGNWAFRRSRSEGRAQPACAGAGGLDFGPSSAVGLRARRRLQRHWSANAEYTSVKGVFDRAVP